ncbi:MAG: hypothetical protein ACLFOY_14750 [Desulfatibacillaceae bacterium]
MIRKALVVFSMILFSSQAVCAFDYLPLKPVVNAPAVKSCRGEQTLRVPMRTSGAHVVLLDANDYELETPDGSFFGKRGVDVRLELKNSILDQLDDYMSCKSPIMCGTQGMLNGVADVTEADPRTRMVAVYQHGWSNGGSALVVRENVQTPLDLGGAKIVTQAHGPHLEYLARILEDARKAAKEQGKAWSEPSILLCRELIGFQGHTPGRAFLEDKGVDAAFVLAPDADVLTNGGTEGTGAEGSVRGARILLSTKSASRIISEVYVVRQDYFDANREQIRDFVSALFKAEERARENVLKLLVEWDKVAKYLFEDAGAVDEARGLWKNYETVGLRGNVEWSTPTHPRGFVSVNNEIQSTFVDIGIMNKAYSLAMANWEYDNFSEGLFDQRRADLPGFDDNQAARVVQDMKQTGDLDRKTLIDFDINFKPNQRTFSEEEYAQEFKRAVDFASTYGGAVLTVEGHSDPLNYLRKKAKGEPAHTLRSIRQAARNLSVNRAIQVRDAIIAFAGERGVTLDESQFVVVGNGISEPRTGMCGGDPCPPRTEAEWLSNMRVNFRIVQVEAEASVFTPPNTW